jgi:hypothetical protein
MGIEHWEPIEDDLPPEARARIEQIAGTITLADGQRVQFSIGENGWYQWGAARQVLGSTADVVDAIVDGLKEAEVPWSTGT